MKTTKLGACVLSNDVLLTNSIKWCIRLTPQRSIDSGWSFYTENDLNNVSETDSFLVIRRLEDIIEIEPSIIHILNFPIGSELVLEHNDGFVRIIDNVTGICVYSNHE